MRAHAGPVIPANGDRSAVDRWKHLTDEPPRLIEHVFVANSEWAEHELRDPRRAKLLDAIEDRCGVADREMVRWVDVGAEAGERGDTSPGGFVLPRAEPEAEADTVMIRVERSACCRQRLADGLDGDRDLRDGLASAEPPRADLRRASDRCLATAANSQRQRALRRQRRDVSGFVLVVGPVECHALAVPQACVTVSASSMRAPRVLRSCPVARHSGAVSAPTPKAGTKRPPLR